MRAGDAEDGAVYEECGVDGENGVGEEMLVRKGGDGAERGV